jgi:hypothetical protein
LIFIGLPVVALALSTDRKEPETVDTNTPAGARKVEAPAKKSKNIEGARETAGAGGGKVGKSGTSEGKEFGALLNPSRPIRSAKALIDIIEEEYPQLLTETSRSPAGQQTKKRIAKQRINFKRIEKAAVSGHANAQYHLAKLPL